MRLLGCLLGWVLVAASAAVIAWEIVARDPEKGFQLRAAGEMWYRIDAGSLNLVQAVIERYLWPPLWDPVLSSLLHLPALVIPAVPGLLLVLLCHGPFRRRGKKHRFR